MEDKRVKEEDKGGEREGSPPSIRLCLGMSCYCYEKPSHMNKEEKGKSVAAAALFTAAQLQELRHQFLIFNLIASGLPLPIHIIRPIWESVAASLGSDNGGIHNHFSNFIGFNPSGFDSRSMMDPEPGRCRRTDGKKWRCYKDVVPDQKYCERHMHRGRGRSRKLVEASEITSESVPVNLQLATPSTKSSGNNYVAKAPTTSSIGSISGSEDTNDAKNQSTAPTTTTTTTNIGGPWSAGIEKIKKCSNNRNAGDAGSFVASQLGFSPDSVLQGYALVGCSSSCLNYRNDVEAELQRCRRTDGKKWRCGADVVPNKKYCDRHLHRGTKKLAAVAEPVTVASAPLPLTICHAIPLAIPKKESGYINLDTNLSISIAASPQQMANEQKSSTSSSSSSSDADTISDDNGSVSHLLDLSP